MADVIKLERASKPEPLVWSCNCGNASFWLYEDGQIQCVACDLMHDGMRGYWGVPDRPEGK